MILEPVYKSLYIGGIDAFNPAAAELFDLPLMHFDAVLRLDQIGILSVPTPDNTIALELPIDDGQPVPDGIFPQATLFIHQHLEAGHSVLSQCHAGISRSVTMALAYLVEYENLSLPQAYKIVKAKHPGAYPHTKLVASLIQHYDLGIDLRRLKRHGFWDGIIKDDKHASG